MHKHAYKHNRTMINFVKTLCFWAIDVARLSFSPIDYDLVHYSILQILHYMFIIPSGFIIKGCYVSLQIIFLLYPLLQRNQIPELPVISQGSFAVRKRGRVFP